MQDRLMTLHNQLMQIEVKGNSTLILAECIYNLRGIIDELQNKPSDQETE